MSSENLNSIYTYCSVPGCKKNPKHTCFTLPREPDKAKLWCKQLGIDINSPRKVFICEVHLEDGLIEEANDPGSAKVIFPLPTPPEEKTNQTIPSTIPDLRIVSTLSLAEEVTNTKSKKSQTSLKRKNKRKPNDQRICSPQSVSTSKVPVKEYSISTPQTIAKINLTEDESNYSIQSAIPPSIDSQLNQHEDETISDIQSTARNPDYDDLVTDIIINSLNPSSPRNNISPIIKLLDVAVKPSPKNKRLREENPINTTDNKKQKSCVAQVETTLKDPNYTIKTIEELKKQIDAKSELPKVLKSLGVKIYLRYPQAYKALHNSLNLPPVSTLNSIFDDTAISTEDDTLFTQTLQYKLSFMSKRDTQCIVCLGETFVKKNLYYDIKRDNIFGIADLNDTQKPQIAYRALMLTVQGLFTDWKQPIAIAFVSLREYVITGKADVIPRIRQWIHKNVNNLLKIGYNVRAFISEADYTSMIPIENGRAIYNIYDVPSLFKLLYFSFLTHDFLYNGELVKRLHILNFYSIDKIKHLRLCPYLTNKHMKPVRVKDIDLKLISEVFSSQTAAAMNVYLDFRVLEPSAINTVNFLSDMSTLLGILYSNDFNESTKLPSGETHVQFLLKILVFFENVKLVDSKTNNEVAKTGTFVEKFVTTIKSILMLYEEMKKNYETESIPTRKLTLDYTESFFDRVKNRSADKKRQSCKEINSAFRNSALINILRPIYNIKFVDLDKSLEQIKNLVAGFQSHRYKLGDVNIGAKIKISSHEYRNLNLLRRDAIVLLAGFILRKCYDHHTDCAAMKNYICIVLHDTSSICKSILQEIQTGICVVPQESFIEFIEMMEIRFRSFMSKDVLETRNGKLIGGLLSSMELVNFAMPCPCFPILYAKKLYLRIRIFNVVKYNNNLFSQRKDKAKLEVNDL